MIMYVDETENDAYFIVSALVAPSESIVTECYKRFKKQIRHYPLSVHTNETVFTELNRLYWTTGFNG